MSKTAFRAIGGAGAPSACTQAQEPAGSLAAKNVRMQPPTTSETSHLHDPSATVTLNGGQVVVGTGKENADGYRCGLERGRRRTDDAPWQPHACPLRDTPGWIAEERPGNDAEDGVDVLSDHVDDAERSGVPWIGEAELAWEDGWPGGAPPPAAAALRGGVHPAPGGVGPPTRGAWRRRPRDRASGAPRPRRRSRSGSRATARWRRRPPSPRRCRG